MKNEIKNERKNETIVEDALDALFVLASTIAIIGMMMAANM